MRQTALAASAVLALAACATPGPPPWRATDPVFVAPKAGFEVVPPPGWLHFTPGDPEILLLTRDGTPLQRIVTRATEVGQPLAMGGGKRAVAEGMSAQELAELVIDDLRAAEALTEVRILENAPATLAGRDGFRVVAAFRDGRGLRTRVAFYGALERGRFYRLTYVAPERHYFALDLPAFEEMARSFRLRPPEGTPAAAAAAQR